MRFLALFLLFPLAEFCFGAEQRVGSQPVQVDPDLNELRNLAAPVMMKGFDFLAGAQAEDGGWPGFGTGSDPAITALVAKAFIQDRAHGPRHPIVRRAVRYVLRYQQPDGGIYNPQVGYANYTSSIVLMMLSVLADPELEQIKARLVEYLKGNQWMESKEDPQGRPVDSGHPWYGGAGYGDGSKRPDLSNTQMMLEALHDSGLPPTDPVYRRAIKFIQRCQMLSQSNDQPFARGADDGGFIYSPANEGESKAGQVVVQGRSLPRSYGSMTYAGFKSLLYANVSRNDPRVRAAWEWIRRHYTLESNPNMVGQQSKEGLYYYYHVFARALHAWGEPWVIDAAGDRHDWRLDLIMQLKREQHADGSWVNTAARWEENNPYLVTAYALLAMQAVLAEKLPLTAPVE